MAPRPGPVLLAVVLPLGLVLPGWAGAARIQTEVAYASQVAGSQIEGDALPDGQGDVLQTILSLPPGIGAFGTPFAEAYGDSSGTVRTFAQTGLEPIDRAWASVFWTGWFVRTGGDAEFRFTVTPGRLEIRHGQGAGSGVIDLPYAEFSMSVQDDLGNFHFDHRARIEGVGGSLSTERFELARNEGDLAPLANYQEVNSLGVVVNRAIYTTPTFTGRIDFSDRPPGQVFAVVYTLDVEVAGDGGETTALAFIGDPLDPSSGITTSYTGLTPVVIPEPAPTLLVVAALAGVAAGRRRALRRF